MKKASVMSSVIVLVLFCTKLLFAASPPIVEFHDSFEVNEWNDLWVKDIQNAWFRSTKRATDGLYSAKVDSSAKDAILTMVNSIDLSGKEIATLTFSWFIENCDIGEYIACDVFDGNWYEIRILRGNLDQENVWHHETVNLSAYLVKNFKIRFRARVSTGRKAGNVDNVKIVSGISPPTDVVSYPFVGIKRIHRTTTSPRPLNMNILEVDLTDQGISLFVTEPNPDRTGSDDEVLARRTSTFVDEFGVQVGINGDFTSSERTMEYETRSVEGLAISNGVQYSTDDGRPALTFTQSNEPYIGWAPFPSGVYNAIGGNKVLVENGQPVNPKTWVPIGGALEKHPRTNTGISADGAKLIIIVVDGRQKGFSEGVTLPEMAEYLIEFGAYTGLNHDGGGSSTLVFEGPIIINYPSDAAGEHVVANHLGIYTASVTTQSDSKQRLRPTALLPNFPNPANPETWIPFTLSEDAHVVIRIYNINGQLIRTLDLGHRASGVYVSMDKTAHWNTRNAAGEKVASGVYFYVMEAGIFRAVRKMAIIR